MKKQYTIIGTLIITMLPNLFALTNTEAMEQGKSLLSGIVSGHNLAFGKDNLYKEALDLGMWNNAISRVQAFVTTIINESAGYIWGKDSTLVNALNTILKANVDLVNSIEASRGFLQSPTNMQKQMMIFSQIAKDMIDVQKTLTSPMSPVTKEEARKLLNNTAVFIETTALKALKDLNMELMKNTPVGFKAGQQTGALKEFILKSKSK